MNTGELIIKTAIELVKRDFPNYEKEQFDFIKRHGSTSYRIFLKAGITPRMFYYWSKKLEKEGKLHIQKWQTENTYFPLDLKGK